ncbi:hypothetical protein BDN72DRAFT_280833 [Pluteus cervinus]|uniref:Uncharacterized protein n=1 Tax=Pluteus cervinus TaxID=181527 RepID=A0ACD3AF69_9AGAR|nr:hypothetical protein BDN72DRAFT_280833 [Pluteus cervinus]
MTNVNGSKGAGSCQPGQRSTLNDAAKIHKYCQREQSYRSSTIPGLGSDSELDGEVSSNLTFSLAPGWSFVQTEDWRKDFGGCRMGRGLWRW